MARFTRRFTPSYAKKLEWLVLVGEECTEHSMRMSIPDENFVRRQLNLQEHVPVLIGRP